MDTLLPISEILSRLMFEKKIRTAELARRINLPQPTVHRIVTGTSPKPHMSSLTPLADFFGISVEQLKGLEPIPWLSLHDNTRMAQAGWREIPLISWEEAATWHERSEDADNLVETVFCDAKVSEGSFALRMNDASMAPQFPIGTLLIVDPEKAIKDRSFVIIKLKSAPIALFRQLLIDGSQLYIKPISPEFEHFRMTLLGDEDFICGTLTQIKLNFVD